MVTLTHPQIFISKTHISNMRMYAEFILEQDLMTTRLRLFLIL